MARLSYGGDLFSPIRCDNSLNEDSFFGGRNSDIFSETWKDISYDGNSKGRKKAKESSIFKEATSTREDKLINRKETITVNGNFSSNVKSSESLVGSSFLKNMSQEGDLSKKKLSHITTRKNSLRNPKKTNELHDGETDLGNKKTNNDKQKLSKHVTMRSSSRKKSTQLVADLKQNDKFLNASFPTLDEESIEKSIDSSKSHKDNLLEHLAGLPERKIGSIQFELNSTPTSFVNPNKEIKEKQNTPIYKGELSSNSNYNKIEITPSTVNCESQTDLLMSELSPAINKASIEKLNLSGCVNQESNLFSSKNSNQSQQIQAGIIEKLVKDTVSFEFDSIRQMLYLQQLSLFKHLDRNAEAMKKNSSDCDVLIKIIDELMEENKQLRKIITNQNC